MPISRPATVPAKTIKTARREIRSYVRREGRITSSQSRALTELWPQFGLEAPGRVRTAHADSPAGPDDGARCAPYELAQVFGRSAPVVMEIGFGNGDHLLQRAQAEPQHNFLGVEVHRPGVGRLLAKAQAAGIANVRVACHDAVEVLRDWLPESSLAEVVIYFPDPWHKKRHHKRRLIQPEFARLAASRLVPGGLLQLATDWADYADHMLAVLNAEPLLQNLAADGRFVPRPEMRSVTRFEARGGRLGHAVFDLMYRRVG